MYIRNKTNLAAAAALTKFIIKTPLKSCSATIGPY